MIPMMAKLCRKYHHECYHSTGRDLYIFRDADRGRLSMSVDPENPDIDDIEVSATQGFRFTMDFMADAIAGAKP